MPPSTLISLLRIFSYITILNLTGGTIFLGPSLEVRIDPHPSTLSCIENMCFLDFLYGVTDGKELNDAMAEIERYKVLSTWTSNQWTDLLGK